MDLILDIGGSSVKSTIIETYHADALLNLVVHTERLSGRLFADVEDGVAKSIRYWRAKAGNLNRLGICTTGSVSNARVVVKAGHFDGYENIDWKMRLEDKGYDFGSVVVSNDGRASAWAEYSAQPKEVRNHIHLVVGTGLGGSAIVNGRLVEGDQGLAGYWGHLVVTEEETAICSCRRMGCAETLCSVPGMLFQYNMRATKKVDDFGTFLSEFELGNPAAVRAIEKAGHALGIIVSVGCNIIDPHRVTIGGGVVQALERIGIQQVKQNLLLETATEVAKQRAHWRVADKLLVEAAKYGNDGGLIGVGMMLK